MRLVPIVEQLKASGFSRVQGVLELIALKGAPPILPAIFVMPGGESAGKNRLSGGAHHQPAEWDFGVVIMLEGRVNQDRTSDELDELEGKVIQALTGWVHPDAGGQSCDYAGARLLTLAGQTISWLVKFKTGRTIRKVPT